MFFSFNFSLDFFVYEHCARSQSLQRLSHRRQRDKRAKSYAACSIQLERNSSRDANSRRTLVRLKLQKLGAHARCNSDEEVKQQAGELRRRKKISGQIFSYMRVDVGGNCAFNKSMRDLCPRDSDCTQLFQHYAFYLAFENANCDEYLTEKFIKLLEYPIVPIVMKRSSYK